MAHGGEIKESRSDLSERIKIMLEGAGGGGFGRKIAFGLGGVVGAKKAIAWARMGFGEQGYGGYS